MKPLLTLLLSALTIVTASAQLAPITLAWDHSPSADVTGYKVYWKTNAAMTNFIVQQAVSLTNTIIVHNAQTGITSTNMPAVQVSMTTGWTYAFQVTATNAAGLESDPSNVVVISAPMKPLSPSGLRIYVEWSTNLVNWVPAEIRLPGENQMAYFRLKVN